MFAQHFSSELVDAKKKELNAGVKTGLKSIRRGKTKR